jgi:hypothetical protein
MNWFRTVIAEFARITRGWVDIVALVLARRTKQLATSDRGDVPGWVLVTVMTSP